MGTETFLGLGPVAWDALGAISTFAAVAVSLWQSRRFDRVRIEASLETERVFGCQQFSLRISNIGVRQAYVSRAFSKELSSGREHGIGAWINGEPEKNARSRIVAPGESIRADVSFGQLVSCGYPAISLRGLVRRAEICLFGPVRVYVRTSEGKTVRARVPKRIRRDLLEYMKKWFEKYDPGNGDSESQ